jgi:hypothetical protein
VIEINGPPHSYIVFKECLFVFLCLSLFVSYQYLLEIVSTEVLFVYRGILFNAVVFRLQYSSILSQSLSQLLYFSCYLSYYISVVISVVISQLVVSVVVSVVVFVVVQFSVVSVVLSKYACKIVRKCLKLSLLQRCLTTRHDIN